jgi:NADH-quinone oxidoreductase subunit L
MHGMGDETDIRKMGGLAKKMPHTHWTFLVSTIALTGIAPLSGFWSKDAILGNALFSSNPAWHLVGPIAYTLGALAALGTAFNMTRAYWLTFMGTPRTQAAEHAHESSLVMTVPLMVLALLAAFGLLLGLPGHSPVSEIFAHFIEPVFAPATARLLEVGHLHAGDHPAWPYFAAWLIAFGGTLAGVLMYGRGLTRLPAALAAALPRTYRLMAEKFRVDELYDAAVIRPIGALARGLWRVVDVILIDGLMVIGVARLIGFFGSVTRLAQNGDVQRYAAYMALAAAAILATVLGVGGLS